MIMLFLISEIVGEANKLPTTTALGSGETTSHPRKIHKLLDIQNMACPFLHQRCWFQWELLEDMGCRSTERIEAN